MENSAPIDRISNLPDDSRHWRSGYFNVNSLIEIVKRHPVENLRIVSSVAPFSQSIFILPTLVVLKLDKLKLVVKDVTLSVQDFKAKLITADVDAFDVPFTVLSNVKILKLEMMKYRFPGINYTGFSVFRNLTNLQLYIFDFPHWDYIVEVLQFCPKLQIFYLIKWEINKNLSINWKYPKLVPECISFELKSCTIVYEGRENDIRFTKYILQNARILEVMKITIHHHLTLQEISHFVTAKSPQ
ncbi:hypothetical protein QL285_028764 [Trifolium repens]|nr:hypothetical protein QL285_028764 [Trifolium repens]